MKRRPSVGPEMTQGRRETNSGSWPKGRLSCDLGKPANMLIWAEWAEVIRLHSCNLFIPPDVLAGQAVRLPPRTPVLRLERVYGASDK